MEDEKLRGKAVNDQERRSKLRTWRIQKRYKSPPEVRASDISATWLHLQNGSKGSTIRGRGRKP